MKKAFILLGILLSLNSYSQQDRLKKHSIGLQINPYLSERFISDVDSWQMVYSLRYAFNHKSGISLGPEFYYYDYDLSYAKGIGLNYGVFVRYTLLKQKKVAIMTEASLYKIYGKQTMSYDLGFSTKGDSIAINSVKSYIAAGISIKIVKDIVLLDLMIKYSPWGFNNGEVITPAYKVQIQF